MMLTIPPVAVGLSPRGCKKQHLGYPNCTGLKTRHHKSVAAWGRMPIAMLFTIILCASVASAGTLSGTVINRTTGKPEPHIPLTLMSPTQGMRDLGSAQSDAQGRFTVTNDTIGAAPILVRATFHDVSFNTFAPPGRPEVEVEIFDISNNPKTITVPSHIVIFQPQGDNLIGAEEYTVDNSSQPPVAFFRTEGNFEFAIPDKGTLGQVTTSAATTMAMPVTQAAIDHGKGRFAIAYPFRPGQTNIRLSYELPYSGNAATVKLPATYVGVKLLVVAPPGVAVTADGLTSAGQEQGMMVYTHEPLAAKASLSVNLSGVGTMPPDTQVDGGQEGNSRTGGQGVIAAPTRIDDIKWFLFAGIAALFAMGALLLSRKQVVVAEGEQEAGGVTEVTPAKTNKKGKKKNASVSAAAGNSQNHATAVEKHVTASVDSLKDEVFRLELRRQAGSISEEEYRREKARIDQLLRELVKG